MRDGGPCSPKAERLSGLLLLDTVGRSAGLREMVRLLGLALKRVCFIGLGWSCLPACALASFRALEDHRQRQASPGLFDMYCIYMNTKHKAHLPYYVSYQEYGFHLGLCVPARFIQV